MHNLNISNLNCTAPKDFLRQFNVNTIVTKIEETNHIHKYLIKKKKDN